ncbi:hypothetical protein C9426_29325 [Serratia sp. S1B]|nr:hypothetical protein C9426_29325 [Serratia sp. S1B]
MLFLALPPWLLFGTTYFTYGDSPRSFTLPQVLNDIIGCSLTALDFNLRALMIFLILTVENG